MRNLLVQFDTGVCSIQSHRINLNRLAFEAFSFAFLLSLFLSPINKKLLKPTWLEKSSEHLWTDFVQLRQQRALYFFEIAKDEIQKQIRIPVRSGMQSSNDSVRLLVRVLRRRDDVEVVAELLLLEVLLRQVFEVPLRDDAVRGLDDDLRLLRAEDDLVAEVARLVVDLDRVP